MFKRPAMRAIWNKDDSLPRSTVPSMSTNSLADHYHRPDSQSPHRYQFTPYYAQSTHPALEPMNTAPSTHQQYSHRQPWPLDLHALDADYSSDPSSISTFSDRSATSDYYAATSQVMGYPESSQRTLLPEAAYSGVYSLPYNTGAMHIRDDAPSAASQQAGEAQFPMDTVAATRPRIRTEEYRGDRRGSFVASEQFYETRLDFESQTAAHRFVPQSLPNMLSHTGGPSLVSSLPGMAHMFPLPTPTSPLPPMTPDSSSLKDAQSPSLTSFALQTRRHSMPDPISPSIVPALMYDGEFGEEYDDDSESSLPSASSDVSRGSYQSAHSSNHSREEWTRSSFGSQEYERISHHQTTSVHSASDSDASPTLASSEVLPSAERPKPSPKKSKMHQCTTCFKMFPRPSGLATHMNSHSGAKPYKCPIPTCTKSFAVRSNAKRHLRTHGIFPTSDHASPSPSQFTVGFDTPLVSEVHDVGKLPSKLRWVPQSLATRTNVDHLRDASPDSDDEYSHSSCPVLSVPLPPVTPSSPTWNPDDRYEERNSYDVAEQSPYLSSQWRAMPGPAIVSPANF